MDILRFVRRRFQPYHGCLVYLPLRTMSVGTSPNLLTNPGFETGSPPTGVLVNTVAAATEGTIINSGGAALKLTGDGSVGYHFAYYSLASFATYKSITATHKAYLRAPATNTFDSNIRLSDGVAEVDSSAVCKDTSFHLVSCSQKLAATASRLWTVWALPATSQASSDVLYVDDVSLTVPQSIAPNGQIIHPEGCSNNGQGFLFNGTTSLLTTESDFIGTSACTIMGWIKPTGWGENDGGRIIDNGKLLFWLNNAGRQALSISSDASTIAESAPNSIILNKKQHIAVTRTSASPARVNFYIDGILSGTANASSGNAAGGTSNIVIGNRLAGDRTFAGTIDDLQVYNRVLSTNEIRNHYLWTRGLP